jgi:gamma-D-glutamyl-L-lysine dipeptidyl-peptidase
MKTDIKLILFIIIHLFAFNLIAQEKIEMDKVKNIIEQVKDKYAPDKRVAIFNIETESSGGKYLLKGETNLPAAKEDLLNRLKGENYSFTDNIEMLPEEGLKDKIYGVVNLSVANLRSKPEHPEELSTQALLGTPLKVYKKKGGWHLVQTPDEYISWIDNSGFQLMTKPELDNWLNSEKIIYIKDYGFAYEQPDENLQRVSDLVIGGLLKYEGEENGFCKVTFPDNRTAFVKKDECEMFDEWLSSRNPTAENIINTAKMFMGIPYLWGGTSAKGFDCSGFTKIVCYLNGFVIPRDASQQVHTGVDVDTEKNPDKLQPGDFLYFGRKATPNSKERITHVAIYIGNGDYIHASGRVRINSFDKDNPNYNAYRDDSFVRAKRVLISIGSNGITTIENNKFYREKR